MLHGDGQVIIGVPSFIPALNSSGYSQTDAKGSGDIVDYSGEHVGVCSDVGCGESISNSSTPGTFTWDFIDGYGDGESTSQINATCNGPIAFYHHK